MKKAVIVLIIIFFAAFLTSYTNSVGAQQIAITNTPSSTPTDALEPTIQALSTRIALLETKTESQATTFQLMLNVITVVTVLAGAVGLTVISGVRWAEGRFKDQLNQAIYRVDPTYYTIYIPKNNFEQEKRRLQLLGFKNLREYAALTDAQTEGITIYKASVPQDADVLRKFLTDKKVEASKAAFVIYVQGKLDEAYTLANDFDNVVTANFPVTIATQIYALARGLL